MAASTDTPRILACLAFGALAAAGSLGHAAPALAQASSIQPIHRTARLPLPKMGPSFRKEVAFQTTESVGTVIVNKDERMLYLVTGPGQALRFRISVGRESFGWTGTVKVGAKQEWPEWRPPAEMRARQPDLPQFVPAGPYNPLGARALYLYKAGHDTLYRIHGTNDPDGVGFDGTSGCFRLTNTDIMDLFERVAVGAKVVVK
jgi:lipoprotein-anchoring transpeptidase ErfK/SrfK